MNPTRDNSTKTLSCDRCIQGLFALPAPTAGAMVARVRTLPLGADLAALDATLHRLGGRSLAELTTSERRVTAMLLAGLLAQAHALLPAIP